MKDSAYDPRDSPDQQRLQLQPKDREAQMVDITLTELRGEADAADSARFCTIESYSEVKISHL